MHVCTLHIVINFQSLVSRGQPVKQLKIKQNNTIASLYSLLHIYIYISIRYGTEAVKNTIFMMSPQKRVRRRGAEDWNYKFYNRDLLEEILKNKSDSNYCDDQLEQPLWAHQ